VTVVTVAVIVVEIFVIDLALRAPGVIRNLLGIHHNLPRLDQNFVVGTVVAVLVGFGEP
jgi:hypothetical protein